MKLTLNIELVGLPVFLKKFMWKVGVAKNLDTSHYFVKKWKWYAIFSISDPWKFIEQN
jgi:hypothetical protein